MDFEIIVGARSTHLFYVSVKNLSNSSLDFFANFVLSAFCEFLSYGLHYGAQNFHARSVFSNGSAS